MNRIVSPLRGFLFLAIPFPELTLRAKICRPYGALGNSTSVIEELYLLRFMNWTDNQFLYRPSITHNAPSA